MNTFSRFHLRESWLSFTSRVLLTIIAEKIREFSNWRSRVTYKGYEECCTCTGFLCARLKILTETNKTRPRMKPLCLSATTVKKRKVTCIVSRISTARSPEDRCKASCFLIDRLKSKMNINCNFVGSLPLLSWMYIMVHLVLVRLLEKSQIHRLVTV